MTYTDDCKETIQKTKSDLRSFAKQKRKEIFSYEKNKKIIETIHSFDKYQQSKNILAFYPLKYEVDLRELFIANPDNKNWFLPKVSDFLPPLRGKMSEGQKGGALTVHPFTNENSLKVGAFNILEPQTEEIKDLSIIDLVFVPALCVDKKGNRLGYGKGYYDRFLSDLINGQIANPTLIVPIFEELVFDEIPVDEFDYKVNHIITEDEIFATLKLSSDLE